MKKVSIILLVLITVNCNNVSETVIINNFSKDYSFSLAPKKNELYYGLRVHVKGFANDTTIIKYEYRKSKLTGKIDTVLNSEYYGDGRNGREAYVFFDPYKATEGKVKIKMTIESPSLF